jgi:hypothetical protein
MPKAWKSFPAELRDVVTDIAELDKEARKSKNPDAIEQANLVKQKLGNYAALVKSSKIPQAEEMKPTLLRLYNAGVEAVESAGEASAAGDQTGPFEIVWDASKSLFDAKCKKTIEEASVQGENYGTKGPKNLHAAARHHHVTNNDGVAFRFDVKQHKLHVLGYGTKHNRNTGRGDSGYDWQT